ncbi:MAG: B12-binding domain-containing radical SAM protein [Candidatus Omnitrophica bacterium]|nr:B12-binding domain-containing radical SAM protein [Candidatus Omnitrophota bacterium]
MKVSLIFTPNVLNPNFSELSFRDDSIGFIPPLSLLSVASILEKEGVRVQIVDMDAEKLSYRDTLDRLAGFSPDLLGFTLSTYSFHPILKWIKKFKEDTSLPIIVGGAHAALYPVETLSHPEIDYLIVGEAEIPLPQFIRAFADNRKLDAIKSVGYRENGRVIVDRTRQFVPDIDSIPYPARHLIRNELYTNILSRRKNFTAMLSTRGCPYRCTFCDQKTPVYRTRSASSFVQEIKYNYEHFNIREFDIYDSTFTANRLRVIQVCELIQAEGLDVSWTIRSRVDSVNEEMLGALKAAGCHTVMYGVESSNPEILKRMKKNIAPDKVRHILRYTSELGINTLGFFMFGYPGETRQTIEDTIRFSLELPLDYVQYTILLPFPDTEIYEYYMQNGLGDFWARYTLDPTAEQIIELIGTDVRRAEVSEYVSRAYRQFYFRPRIIWKRAWGLRSARELKRLSKGAYGILKNSLLRRKAESSPQSHPPMVCESGARS